MRAPAQRWIGDVLALSVASLEGPVMLRLMLAWQDGDLEDARRWNDEFLASRETAELRAETLQMGFSLRRLLEGLAAGRDPLLFAIEEISFPAAFAFSAQAAGIAPATRSPGYLFAWVENQALAASKAIPLGQTDTQRLLRDVAAGIPALVERAMQLEDGELRISRPASPSLPAATRRSTAAYSGHNPAMDGPLRVGIGGPVGSGKTALTLALCKALRDKYDIAGRHQRHLHRGGRALPGAQRGARARAHHRRGDRRLPAHRDPRGRLDQPRGGGASAERFPALDVVFIESGGDNLASTFSPELSDLTLYVIDVAGGRQDPAQGRTGDHQVRTSSSSTRSTSRRWWALPSR
jgi:urease accessory protein